MTPVANPHRQRGSFLLEALVAVLIVALGVLGLVGLQARAMQDTDESQYRSEAAFLANDVISQMWTSDQTTLEGDFENNATSGSPYDNFKTIVQRRLPGADLQDPDITVTPRGATAAFGYDVQVTIYWQPPSAAWRHRYDAMATVRLNN
ncbi:MAG: type IV pilus modification protein PilV [Betaproteobacteria bacterium]|nr:type IV pilus modification protein PilV [Betaproteobacteria bacterium]MCC7215653.1 type IV pilus modification protein PilV [Burkholderiales bacterium]